MVTLDGDRFGRAGRDQRTANRPAGESNAQRRIAGVSCAASRAGIELHDASGDGCGAGGRIACAGVAGIDRVDHHQRQQRSFRQHGHDVGAEAVRGGEGGVPAERGEIRLLAANYGTEPLVAGLEWLSERVVELTIEGTGLRKR